jgi:hypothetical protein
MFLFNRQTYQNYPTKIWTRLAVLLYLQLVIEVALSDPLTPCVSLEYCTLIFLLIFLDSLDKFVPFSQVRDVTGLTDLTRRLIFFFAGTLEQYASSFEQQVHDTLKFILRSDSGSRRGPRFQRNVRCLYCVYTTKSDWVSVSPQEKEIIEHTHSCYVLGRSGTG